MFPNPKKILCKRNSQEEGFDGEGRWGVTAPDATSRRVQLGTPQTSHDENEMNDTANAMNE